MAQAQGRITSAGLASLRHISKSPSRRFPVTVTQLPVSRCEICQRTMAYRPGSLSEVLTEHYRRAHPEALADVQNRLFWCVGAGRTAECCVLSEE